jgi:hypothetical protein
MYLNVTTTHQRSFLNLKHITLYVWCLGMILQYQKQVFGH